MNITDVELDYNNQASHVRNTSELATQVLRFSVTNRARHNDNLSDVCHDETHEDRTSDDGYY